LPTHCMGALAMNKAVLTPQTQNASLTPASLIPPRQGILQRKCACGSHTSMGGQCDKCAAKKGVLQRKLTIGASNDPLEQEADRVADAVVSGNHSSQLRTISSSSPIIQRDSPLDFESRKQPTTFPVEEQPKKGQERDDAEKNKLLEGVKKVSTEVAKLWWESFSSTQTGQHILTQNKRDWKPVLDFFKDFADTTVGETVLSVASSGALIGAFLGARAARDEVKPTISPEGYATFPREPKDEKFFSLELKWDFVSVPKGFIVKTPWFDTPEIGGDSKVVSPVSRDAPEMIKPGNKVPNICTPSDPNGEHSEALRSSAQIYNWLLWKRQQDAQWINEIVGKYKYAHLASPFKSGLQLTEPALGNDYQKPSIFGDQFKLTLPSNKRKQDTPALHKKLSIGSSNDPLEQEADRVADQVMSTPLTSAINRTPPKIQRFTGQASDGLNTAPPSVEQVLASSGRPLEPALRQDMEARFGQDFSQVRVHTGSEAERSAREVNARAYTVGHNVVFGADQFEPRTNVGRRLIAHELTHVTQQTYSPCVQHMVQRQFIVPPPQNGGFQRGFRQDQEYLRNPTPEETVRRQAEIARENAFNAALKPFRDAVLGEFEEDPSTAGIVLDTTLGLIPIVDQGLDLRDVIAHIYMMSEKREYTKPMRWVGLALTLIGVIPELGSAIKGVAKLLLKKGAHSVKEVSTLLGLLRGITKIGGEISKLASAFRKLLADNWAKWVQIGKNFFAKSLELIEKILERVRASSKLNVVHELRGMAEKKLDEAFEKLRKEIDDALDVFSPQLALADGGRAHVPNAPRKARSMHTTGSSASGKGKAASDEVDEALETMAGPRVKGRKRPRVEDPSHPKGSRAIPSRPAGEDLPRRMDIEDIPCMAGETARQAVNRVRRVVGQKLQDLPELAAAWDAARKKVLQSTPVPTNAKEARAVFDKVRDQFWEDVADNTTLNKYFTSAGFEFPGTKGRAPRLSGVDPAIPDWEKTVSLDHLIEVRNDFSKALDAKNLKMEFSMPNTVREIKQMRHPELR